MGGRTLDQFRSRQRAKGKSSPSTQQESKAADDYQPKHNKTTQSPEED
ncbi:hypothetical protein SAMN04488500_12464 [Sporomusa malonica]|uniref:Uncharacterized protein n=1 Tax=Sporomusa malonica TaxID=112901 RepID=A0A1W2EI32_9FIRM|nr:hypothetical protein SAMN04488500_12464 [Sporomusa malonica]